MKHLIQEKWHHCPLSAPKVSLQSRWSDRGPFPWLSAAVIMKPNLLSVSHLTCLARCKALPWSPQTHTRLLSCLCVLRLHVLCLECSFPRIPMVISCASFQSQVKCLLLRKAYSDTHGMTHGMAKAAPHQLLYIPLSCFIFSWHLLLFAVLILLIISACPFPPRNLNKTKTLGTGILPCLLHQHIPGTQEVLANKCWIGDLLVFLKMYHKL